VQFSGNARPRVAGDGIFCWHAALQELTAMTPRMPAAVTNGSPGPAHPVSDQSEPHAEGTQGQTALTSRLPPGQSLCQSSSAGDRLRDDGDHACIPMRIRVDAPVAARGSTDAKPSAPTRLRSSIAVTRTSCAAASQVIVRRPVLTLAAVAAQRECANGGRGEEDEITCAAATGMATSHVRHVRDAAVMRSAFTSHHKCMTRKGHACPARGQ